MFRSLRFRLPLFFLAGIALAGLVASLIAIRLFQDYAHDTALAELRREAAGLARLYGRKAGDISLSTRDLELATGDKLYYAGLPVDFPEDDPSITLLTQLPSEAVPTA